MQYTVVIGLEVHVQLLTQSKLFCGCANRFNPNEPNVQTCPVCLGLPGALPVMNRRAFELAVRAALALDCRIARFTKWDRKQYFYPDLPKGYQISQYDLPLSYDGAVWLDPQEPGGERRRVGIIRVHLEEDAGKNLHDPTGRGESRVDLNRAGTPLLEIVTEPDLRAPAEARRFLEELRLLLRYLDVSDCNMQEGSLRCDANVNLHVQTDAGEAIATPIVEVKNLNSFRAVEQALSYEVDRQWSEWQKTGARLGEVPKQTRGWDEVRGVTFAQRGKEEASDYRYFPDPDLVPVTVSDTLLASIRETLCEFPADRRRRFQSEYGLSEYDASVIVDQGRALADYFEAVAQGCGDGKLAANWVTQEVLRILNETQVTIEQFALDADVLVALLRKVAERTLTNRSAREVFSRLLAAHADGAAVVPSDVDRLVDELGLAMRSDSSELKPIIADVVAQNDKAVAAFRGGKQNAIGPLIGQVMRSVKGADPQLVRQLLIEEIQRGDG